MDFVGALRAFLTGEPEGIPGELADMVAVVDAAAGTHAAAARAVGVSTETWRRWRRGEQRPAARTRPRLLAAVRRAMISPERAAKFAAGEWWMSGTAAVSNDERHRDMDTGRYLRPDVMADVVDKGRAGGWHAAAGALADDIGGPGASYVEGMVFPPGHDDIQFHWK